MSKYLELKAQIEAMTAQLESTRMEEFEAEVVDMKKRITAFGIRPQDLFSKEDLAGTVAAPKRVRLPAKYTLNGHGWSGRGAPPKWYLEAIQAGKSPTDMLIRPS